MSIYHIVIEVEVDDASIAPGYRHHVQESLEALADVMAVQAEDGLYTAGSPEVETFEHNGDTVVNERVADIGARVGSVQEVQPGDAFDFASSGSRQGFIETGRYSTVAEEREINGDGDPDRTKDLDGEPVPVDDDDDPGSFVSGFVAPAEVSVAARTDEGIWWAYNPASNYWEPVYIDGVHYDFDGEASGVEGLDAAVENLYRLNGQP